ncbi:MAG: insulinase family protein [Bryobacterales bacterium]|nr:insulinase family protein [Bryobacterales bacterium]
MPAVSRSVPPIAPALPVVRIPQFEEYALSNGLPVVLLRDTRFPSVSLRLGIAGGNRVDPPARTGIAETLCSMFSDGTSRHSARDLADATALLGASMHFSASDDFFVGSGTVLEDNFEPFVDLFSECLLESVYPEDELALHKQNRIQELMVERSEAGYWADARLYRDVFGEHPYAVMSPQPEHIAALERDDLSNMWARRIGPREAVLVLVGDLPETGNLLALLESRFGAWRNATEAASTGQASSGSKPKVTLIHRAGSVQAEVRLGRPAIARSHADYFPLSVLNTLLGGGASSRLFMEIREKQGLAYHVSSSMMALMEHGMVSLSTQVSMDRVGVVIRGLQHEMQRLEAEPIAAEELQSVRNYLNGTFVLRLESHSSLANQISAIKLLGLGDDYLERYVERVAAVSTDALREAAARYFRPEDFSIVVAGDAVELEPQLREFGEVAVEEAGAE